MEVLGLQHFHKRKFYDNNSILFNFSIMRSTRGPKTIRAQELLQNYVTPPLNSIEYFTRKTSAVNAMKLCKIIGKIQKVLQKFVVENVKLMK